MIHYKKNDVVICDASLMDIFLMEGKMRPMEISEVWASEHLTPKEALLKSYEKSTGKLTLWYQGQVVAMFGIVPESLLSNRAMVWLLTTDTIYKMKISFAKLSLRVLSLMLSRYGLVYNFVDARNEQCLNWLRWLGANIYPAQPYGLDSLPFHYFEFGEK